MDKYKATLLLPKTEFPMRAELPKREPAQLAKWRAEKIYERILAARQDAAKNRETTFILHDGPPFANGDAHMGHALNMVLKDLVLKSRTMAGNYTPFVPGWDCHGLPIEHKVMKELGAAETDPVKIREKCEATARHFIQVQGEQFQRLGIFGDWEKPYLTLDPSYEAETLRVFATLVGKNLVYQGLRPVYWSTGCQTALAEAEIEYQERTDPAIYVKFPVAENSVPRFPKHGKTSLLIWTTTPWTLPANLAVAVNPNLNYGLVELSNGETLIMLMRNPDPSVQGVQRDGIMLPLGFKLPEGVTQKGFSGPMKGEQLVGLTYRHPFLDDGRKRQVFAADFVTADTGTGLVHIAPGHGQDDYILGQQHGLPVLAPVDDRGCLTAEFLSAGVEPDVQALVGQYVFKANAAVIEILKARGQLFAQEDSRHEYPHCWRSKTPIVFRAVKQWFIRMDAFRSDALAAIDGVTFVPESGRNRIRGAVETRPDWCISRQRTWGIPLPVFYGEDGAPLLDEKTVRAFADLVEKEGAGIWFSLSAEELSRRLGLPPGLKKGRDTLDVWIDSGTSWAAVVKKRLTFPADLYLEGSDQHRGWFQSSLLTAVAAVGQAPYRGVLTHGFLVDTDGKKLSKSGTGYQKPIDLMTLVNQHGADVLRLWVASQDYQNEIPFSNDIFARMADAYRSIRNTLRILLGNLADFDATRDALPKEKWTEIDRYVHDTFAQLSHYVQACYARYDYPQIFQAINRFCTVELSALYVDLLKDRLYCHAEKDPARRAAQTVLHEVFDGLAKLLAPILVFTAEEAWQFRGHGDSVHTQLFPALVDMPDNVFLARWKNLLQLRGAVNEKLEAARRDKVIGKSIEARVEIATRLSDVTDGSLPLAQLEELFIVSQVVVTKVHAEAEEKITVTRAEEHGAKKCVRCWRYYDKLGADPAHPELCERCTGVVLDFGK
jgi:isoleucyl-tRNA synthetase